MVGVKEHVQIDEREITVKSRIKII